MKRALETVLFDFGGTLDADGVAWKERFYAQYRAAGLEMTPERFAPAFYAADDALVGRLPRDADLGATVRRLAANLETELAGTDRGECVAARFLADATAAFDRNRPVLERLGQRYRLGVVSNFYGNLDAVCRGAGLAELFAVIIDSHVVGAVKPDAAIFRAALETLGASPETTLMVGDSLRRDRAGARRLGMRFVWIAPRAVQEAEPARDHPAIERLTELMEMLA
jgi:HAD superfamily hydrolase (TIGR01549 family)